MLSKANGLVKVTQRKFLCIQDLCHQVLNWFFLSHFIFYDSFYLVFKIIKSSENKLTKILCVLGTNLTISIYLKSQNK